ncbi:hypothetical protein N0V90_002372 [Kalmusia sp. IMI 367209]|nr:hypothetical protein N0V90_002372 [Kalmusia sp. IMI 367209]
MNRAPLPSPESRAADEPTNVTAQDAAASNPTARPPLQRQPASNPPTQKEPSATSSTLALAQDEDDTDADMSDSAPDTQSTNARAAKDGPDDVVQEKSSPDELEIERLRNLQLKAIQKQQRARVKSATSTPSSTPFGTRRVSPIKEEPVAAMSPTLEGAFSSPLPTTQTTSTESTESAKTIRGSMPPTPAARALRTPSYPFPTVPSTPMAWSSAFHQPFTSLSPTVSAMYGKDYAAPREHVLSESSTPAASGTPFVPGERPLQSPLPEDPRFPSPNLYELVLAVNSEPGLAAWWNCVTNIMHDWYGVERATLAVPADSSDIENVPWGQKSTFHVSSPGDSPRMPARQETKVSESKEAVEKPPSPESDEPSHIPPGDQNCLHGIRLLDTSVRGEISHPRVPSQGFPNDPVDFSGQLAPTFSDPDFSSIGGAENLSPTAVFTVLRALDHEPDALIDNAGINRVLERGRLVTLTRDYSPHFSTSSKSSIDSEQDDLSKSTKSHVNTQEAQRPSTIRARGGAPLKNASMDHGDRRLQPRYEEYEQYPSSPWAQSPAPSPAIQNDPSENPFFTTGNVDEDTFNPSGSSQDYTQYGVVEAIGVDKASTVTHIPFIHPTLSQMMQPPEPATPCSYSILV